MADDLFKDLDEDELEDARERLDTLEENLANREVSEEPSKLVSIRERIETLTTRVKNNQIYLKSKEGLIDFFRKEKQEELMADGFELARLRKEYKEEKASPMIKAVIEASKKRTENIIAEKASKKWLAEESQRKHDKMMTKVVQDEMKAADRRRKLEEGYIPPKRVM